MKNKKRLSALFIALCLTLTSVFTLTGQPAAFAAGTGQTHAGSTEAVTKTPATQQSAETVTESPATQQSAETVTESPATQQSTETVTETPATQQSAETVTEASEPPAKTPQETPAATSTEQTGGTDTAEDTGEVPVQTYEANTVPITFGDITFMDAYKNPVDPASRLTYTYIFEDSYVNLLEFELYYNGSRMGSTIYKYYGCFTTSFYKRNPITNTYENVTDISHAAVGDYQIVLQPTSASFYGGNNVYYTLENAEPITLNITITPKNLNDADIICTPVSDQTYEGTPLCPLFDVIHSYSPYSSYTLIPNISYECTRTYYGSGKYTDTYTPVYNSTYDYSIEYINNTQAGQGIIRITGTGNYTGTRDITFNIFTAVSTLIYSGYRDTAYTGQNITFPGFTASEGTKTLVPGVDYSIAYSNNKNYGEAVITVTGMGYYTGTYDVHFGIVPKKVNGIKASSPKKLQAKISWSKCTGADGFEIARYNTKKKTYEVIALLGDGRWQVYQDAAASLKNNVSYKYRIRPYVSSEDGSRRYYGAAATKKCKVTKAYKELNIPIYTGCADVDYAAEVICKKVIKKGMSQQQKVKALYDWTVEHCTHDKDYGNHKTVYSYSKNKKKANTYNTKIWKQIYTGKAECNFDGYGYDDYSYDWGSSDDWDVMFPQQTGWVNGKGQFYRTYEAFQTHKGGCSYITRLFKALINHAGLECTLVDGNFKNRDGSKMYHYWCFIRVNKKYAWYDVDIAVSHKNIRYTWYKKGAKYWHTCHEWDPRQNENIPASLN